MKIIQHFSEVNEGDSITYYCPIKLRDVNAHVIGLLDGSTTMIVCKQINDSFTDLVDFRYTTVYLKDKSVCECGAAHTTFTDYHYKWCPLFYG